MSGAPLSGCTRVNREHLSPSPPVPSLSPAVLSGQPCVTYAPASSRIPTTDMSDQSGGVEAAYAGIQTPALLRRDAARSEHHHVEIHDSFDLATSDPPSRAQGRRGGREGEKTKKREKGEKRKRNENLSLRVIKTLWPPREPRVSRITPFATRRVT